LSSSSGSGLFAIIDENGREQFVEVPQDDYRSIRRATLDLDAFDRYLRDKKRGHGPILR
jgi:hypothetical protein